MREFKALRPQELPTEFDLEIHTEEPIVEVKESPGKITISYTFPGFYLVDDSREVAGKKMDLKQVNIKSTGFLTESGKPLLPSFGRYVQIPRNCNYKVTVEKGKPVQFDGIELTPAQTQLTDDSEQKHEFEYDKEFYAKDVLYPEEIAKVTGPFSVDQYSALLVHVAPLQYNPAQKRLIGYGDIKVNIELEEKRGAEGGPGSLIEHGAFGNLLLNPGHKVEEKLSFEISPISFKAVGPELLIIYAKVFEKAAQRLSNWKQRRGILTETVCVDTIGNDVTTLKTYIRGRRGVPFCRLRYVLLFGDPDLIATETDLPSLESATNTATDYYYSTQYDENSPDPAHPQNILFFPWLSIGRIPVRPDNEAAKTGDSQAQGIVDQIISYEKDPPGDAKYFKRMVFAAYFQGNHPDTHKDERAYLRTIEGLRAALAAQGYTTKKIYVSDDPQLQYYDDGTPIPSDVKAAVVNGATATQMIIQATTEGQLYIGHRDHGNWDGWVHPSFQNTDLDKVSGDIFSIFYSINCQTGRFDKTGPAECFAEKNLRLKGTAPSLIAATRNSNTFLNNDLIMAIFDATFGGILPTFPGGNASYPLKNNRLGDVLNYGKSYLPIANSGNDPGVKDHFQIYHVIGDPTLELWKDEPQTINMQAKIIKNSLDIQLTTCPSGALVTIWHDNTMLKRMEPNTTHITMPIKGLVPKASPLAKPNLAVCFWAPGYRYKEVKVAIA